VWVNVVVNNQVLLPENQENPVFILLKRRFLIAARWGKVQERRGMILCHHALKRRKPRVNILQMKGRSAVIEGGRH